MAPALPAPLPAHLLERATEIHERQTKALTDILRALTRAQRQRRYVDRAATDEPLVARYVDVSG